MANQSKNQSSSKKNLSDAADKMRTSKDPKERSDAAKTMGQAGGSRKGSK
ncbi:MAG: hypothetical protein ACK5Z5_05400 [Neisseriaceae bacterium]